jgi:hypothetical protein
MEVTRSVYYAYVQRKSQPKTAQAVKQAEAVKECFHFHRRRYGSRRIAKDVGIGRYLARRLMREQNLVAIQPKSFVPKTTNSKHGFRISPNLLKDNQIEVNLKGQAIVGDITYLGLRNGKFCYLATFQDKYTRRIVGWAIMAEISEITIEKRVGIMSVGDFITNTYEVKRKLDSLGITPVQFYNSVESLKIDSNSPQSLFIIKDKSVKDILNQLIGESNLKYWTIIRWGNDGEFISIVVS